MAEPHAVPTKTTTFPRARPVRPAELLASSAAAGGDEPLHELRVRIPADLHRQLLSLKVLRGKSLAESVSDALDAYFAERARRAGADENA